MKPGSQWERQLDAWHDAYRRDRIALVLRAHPPVKIIAKKHDAHFFGCFAADGPPDYYGVVGGQAVVFDAKDCESGRFPFASIPLHQARDLEAAIGHGAKAAIALRFQGEEFWVPWDALAEAYWTHMERRGRASAGTASLSAADVARLGRRMGPDGWVGCL